LLHDPAHLGHDERNARLEAVRGRLVDRDRTARDGVGDELARGAGADGEEEDVDVAAGERLGRRLLHRPAGDLLAGGARRGEHAHVVEPVLAQEPERDRADRARAADDAYPCARWHLPHCRDRLRLKLPIAPRWIVVVFGAVALGLLPWAVWLMSSLQPRHTTRNWDLAWSGFDTALASLCLVTAYAAWRRRFWLPSIAAATGALLVADAWFDVVLESRSADIKVAVFEAFAGELPFAAVCFWIGFTSHVDPRGRARE
jgi:hypothetical protein